MKHRYRRIVAVALAAFFLLGLSWAMAPVMAQDDYTLVILGGRVMDPETGFDQVANIGLEGGRITVITTDPIKGRDEIDATGLIVSPGFIDILANVRPERAAHHQKITDGVTTVFGMHGGPLDTRTYDAEMQAMGPQVNYAATVGHRRLRREAGATDPYQAATAEQILRMQDMARRAIDAGAVGIGFGINYSPGASYEEVFALFQVAAEKNVPVHLHARYKGNVFPLTMSLVVQEVVAMAAATGAQAQVAHLISSTVGSAPLSIALMEGATRNGVDVSFDFHVWTRNQTWLQSALYDDGWQERFGGATYSDIYVADTQEQLTKTRFDELRAAEGPTSIQTEFIPEAEIELGIRSPLGIISSDGGGLIEGRGHPRSVGTFARFLGRYVRDKKIVGQMEGIAKITLLPARRLERAVPRMQRKGRLQVGADADITVFDPYIIRERASYAEPNQYSEGIRYVLVNGTPVIYEGEIVADAAPGQWLRHPAGGH